MGRGGPVVSQNTFMKKRKFNMVITGSNCCGSPLVWVFTPAPCFPLVLSVAMYN